MTALTRYFPQASDHYKTLPGGSPRENLIYGVVQGQLVFNVGKGTIGECRYS